MTQTPAAIPPSTTTATTAPSSQTGARRPFGGSISALSRCTRPSTSSDHVSSRRVMAWRLSEGNELVRQLLLRRQSGAADEHGDDRLAGREHGGDLLAHVVARLTEARAAPGPAASPSRIR